MTQAIFSSSLSYTPGAGGSITQSFNVATAYTAVNSGTIDVPSTTTTTAPVDIPFGSVGAGGVGGARGVIVRNNMPNDIKLYVNKTTPYDATEKFFLLPSGGMLMYWVPAVTIGADAVVGLRGFLQATGPGGTIDYITLGE